MVTEIVQAGASCGGKCDIQRQHAASREESIEMVRGALQVFFAGAERVAVMGIGSRLRGDDAAGLLTAALLRRGLARRPAGLDTLVVSGDTAPENVTGEIKRFRPTHLLILDAADTGREAGHVEQVDPSTLSSNLSANSHALPIKMVIEYIVNFVPCAVTIVGIAPETIKFRQRVSVRVREASRQSAVMIADVLREAGRSLQEGRLGFLREEGGVESLASPTPARSPKM